MIFDLKTSFFTPTMHKKDVDFLVAFLFLKVCDITTQIAQQCDNLCAAYL